MGSSTYRWRNLILAGYGNLGSLQIGGTTVIDSSRALSYVALFYSPSSNVLVANDDERSVNSSTPVKAKETRLMLFGGTLRTYFEMKLAVVVSPPGYGYGQVYRNGTAIGTLRSIGSTSYVGFTEDLPFSPGDYYQIYGYYTTGYLIYFRYQRILGNLGHAPTAGY